MNYWDDYRPGYEEDSMYQNDRQRAIAWAKATLKEMASAK